VIAVPARLAVDIARLGRDQEELEDYLVQRLRAGEPLDGLYPPDETNRAAYADRRAQRQTPRTGQAVTGGAR
jgi:hypothetical protein